LRPWQRFCRAVSAALNSEPTPRDSGTASCRSGGDCHIDSWLQQPNVEIVEPDDRHWRILRTLIAFAGTAGNLTSDAHLAAVALGGGWTLVSTDHDFQRFAGLSVVNPLATSS
jgi:predicted nucleic acid-binding protein